MTLDHLIATVPDIRSSHARLLAMGFEEAWPIGPFWPSALTSGIALGGVNLELVQPDAGVDRARIDTLVLAPDSLAEGRAFLAGFVYEEREKVESDLGLLALRGFPPAMASTPQKICTNLYPEDPPFPFFLCRYAPFLRGRLASPNFAAPRGKIVGIDLLTPDRVRTEDLFRGSLGSIELIVDADCHSCVESIHFADGSSLSAGDL